MRSGNKSPKSTDTKLMVWNIKLSPHALFAGCPSINLLQNPTKPSSSDHYGAHGVWWLVGVMAGLCGGAEGVTVAGVARGWLPTLLGAIDGVGNQTTRHKHVSNTTLTSEHQPLPSRPPTPPVTATRLQLESRAALIFRCGTIDAVASSRKKTGKNCS